MELGGHRGYGGVPGTTGPPDPLIWTCYVLETSLYVLEVDSGHLCIICMICPEEGSNKSEILAK